MSNNLTDKPTRIGVSEYPKPDRAHFGFYMTKYQKQQILTLVKIGVSANQSMFIKDAAISRIEQYAHLITPNNLVKLLDKEEKISELSDEEE